MQDIESKGQRASGVGTRKRYKKMIKRHPVNFSGKAGEYFRIWIVNVFLTILTGGIYSAWAKVRTRRYFYAHTSIDGFAFDYLANPINILKGHLIVGVFFIAYMLSGRLYPEWGFVFVVLFYLFFPFLMYKSIKFYTHNSAYRNIRFHFDGTLWESYQLFLVVPILIPLTLGFFFPYWEHLKKRWFFENSAFGTTFNEFNGKAGFFYKTYFFSFLQIMLLMALLGGVVALSMYTSGLLEQIQSPELGEMFQKGFIVFFGLYAVMIISVTMIQQYVFARVTNYCWLQSQIGPVKVNSQLQFRKLFWIRFTNILAIILSIGLLIPWAKVRRARYILSCMSVKSTGNLDDFTTGVAADVTAVGDAASDFFDFDFGL
ncbi:MAG: DUF898 domain-containing protein [Desulfobacteraceae bacterium]|nr:DUF898 domain-containing protein [Desulfobacteraceae bacterium]